MEKHTAWLYVDPYRYQISSFYYNINISLPLTVLPKFSRTFQKARSLLPRLPRRSGWSSSPLPCRKTVRRRRRRECSRSADRPGPAVSPGRSSPCSVPAERPWRPCADPKCPVSGLRTPGCSPSDSPPASSSRTCSAGALQNGKRCQKIKRREKKRGTQG